MSECVISRCFPFLERHVDNRRFCCVVKCFLKDDFASRIQDKNLELGTCFFLDILNITIGRQNVGILFSSSSRCYLLFRKRVDIADRFCVLRTIIIPGKVLRKQCLPRTSFSNLGMHNPCLNSVLLATPELFLWVVSFQRSSCRKLLFASIEYLASFPVQIFISFCNTAFSIKRIVQLHSEFCGGKVCRPVLIRSGFAAKEVNQSPTLC